MRIHWTLLEPDATDEEMMAMDEDGYVDAAPDRAAPSEFTKGIRLDRAKLIAAILTNHGIPVTPPDEASLDDVERERWNACVEIEKALSRDRS